MNKEIKLKICFIYPFFIYIYISICDKEDILVVIRYMIKIFYKKYVKYPTAMKKKIINKF